MIAEAPAGGLTLESWGAAALAAGLILSLVGVVVG
jgi:hypothetical protein